MMTIYGKYKPADRQCRFDRFNCHPWHVRNDEYHLADIMCHVFRRGNDSQRYAGKHHIALRTFHEENGQRRIELPSVRGLFLNLATADQYISIILTGNMFRDIYAKKGYESCLLSRTTEDSVTVTSVLIPWNTCGMTQATILSVPTLVYLPYCFFNIISPLMSIAVAAIGYKIARRP